MINLSKCKFGDRLKTRDGRLAIFMHKLPQANVYCLAVAKTKERNDYFSAYFTKVSRKTGDFYECEYGSERYREYGDIVGKWEDEIEKPAIPYIKKKPREEIKLPKGVSEEILRAYGKGRFK